MSHLITLRLLKEDGMAGNVSCMGEIRNAYKVTLIEPE
jgi:hypothetical protein